MPELVLLTGATGFVGRHVLRALEREGVPVRIVARQPPRDLGERSGGLIPSADIFAESTKWWTDVCAGVNIILHMAWYTEPGLYLQSPVNLDCLEGTLRMAKGAAAAGVRRFVGIGTCSEYDSNAEEFHSSTPLRPVTVYAATKAATYLSLSQWLPNMGTEFLWCRLFYLFGDGEDERRLVGYIRSRLSKGQSVELTNGLQVRDFLDVRIAADMIVKAALGQKQGAANICSGVPITIRELAMRVADEYGMRDKLIFGARPDNLFDPPKIVGKVESLNTP